jgi:hypothetical protein
MVLMVPSSPCYISFRAGRARSLLLVQDIAEFQKVRAEAIEKGTTTNHWPHEFVPQPTPTRLPGGLPVKTPSAPLLSIEQMRLAGVVAY